MPQEQKSVQGWSCGLLFECTLYLLLIAFGALCVDTTVPDSINFLVTEYLDSALYSQIVGTLLMATATWQIIVALRTRKGATVIGTHAAAGAAMSALYTLGIVYVGFYVSTFVYLFACATLVEDPAERNWKKKMLFSLGSAVVLYAMFSLFKIYLPPTPLL